MGEIGEGLSRKMYKGHMAKPKGVGSKLEGEKRWSGECGGVKMETTVLEQ